MVRQPFHLVDPSPWPLLGASCGISLTISLAAWFHGYTIIYLLISTILIILVIVQWWRDVIREGTFIGAHTQFVITGLRWGIVLFITSEIIFFLAFFWAFFHRRLAPTPELGCCWPPTGVSPINPFSIPLLNTAVLLASGVTVTWAHHRLMLGDRKRTIIALSLTVLLGAYFTLLQAEEYIEAPFSIADRTYGSTFFVATGFHGIHVLIGSTFLLITLIRAINHQFSSFHHLGFEAAAWYWHFVDVVWIFLFICIYWWGT